MELWIRSQKNEKLRPMLLKANEFEIGDYNEDMNCIVVNNLYCVGVYKTKERALEVLDEIQEFITRADKLSYIQNSLGIEIQGTTEKGIVYNMPKE